MIARSLASAEPEPFDRCLPQTLAALRAKEAPVAAAAPGAVGIAAHLREHEAKLMPAEQEDGIRTHMLQHAAAGRGRGKGRTEGTAANSF